MKVAVNMRLPNGAEKTLVYGAKHVADAYTKAKEEHPTWDVIAVAAWATDGFRRERPPKEQVTGGE